MLIAKRTVGDSQTLSRDAEMLVDAIVADRKSWPTIVDKMPA